MASQKQIEANRRNAQKSTGPKTPEGRAAVRFNALRHGLSAETAVIPGEDPDHFEQLRDALLTEHRPVGPTEELLVQQIAHAAWRLQRIRAMESGMFELRWIDLGDEIAESYTGLESQDHHAYIFRDDVEGPNFFGALSRYEARAERSFYKALRELKRLQAERPRPVSESKFDKTNPIELLPDSEPSAGTRTESTPCVLDPSLPDPAAALPVADRGMDGRAGVEGRDERQERRPEQRTTVVPQNGSISNRHQQPGQSGDRVPC